MDSYQYHFVGMHYMWWVLWLILIIPSFFVAGSVRRRMVRRGGDSPLRILQRRYAAGEITTEDYEERKTRLAADRSDTTPLPLPSNPGKGDATA